jgi:hypothetical protein
MLRFTIRELLLIMVIVGLALAWQIDHRHQLELREADARLQRATEQQFEALCIMIEREGYQLERDDGGWPVEFSRGPTIEARSFNR